MLDPYGVIIDSNALSATEERRFPASRHRSKRVLKKLVKRYGSEFYMEPAAFNVGGRLVVHPEIYRMMQAETEQKVHSPRSIFELQSRYRR